MATGEEYIRAITRLEADRRARSAFHDLVTSLAPSGAGIFDFGCGPGIDAKCYAQQGYRVVAYDADERMCATFAEHCEPQLRSGQVELLRGNYRQFLDVLAPTIRDRFEISMVTANFAPLNMIEDLHELFSRLHACTLPRAKVVASVLHPYFVIDMRHRWWWRNRGRGCFGVASMAGTVYRRSFDDFARQAAPYFTLEGIARGLPGSRFRSSKRASWTALATSRYAFLRFSRNDAVAAHLQP
ncbi:MAG TPA: methyltransferase domain-containing protein [Steroidobacteraceae bacterium]|nr:methyltransferase domain-containing protein [Steroidobacteraceae bacterium]